MPNDQKPTKLEIEAAAGKTIPDIIAPGLDLLFCGINPGLYSGATGHHFARPGNRFWPALHASGFTRELLHPSRGKELLQEGAGITNLVARSSRSADELSAAELRKGADDLKSKVLAFKPAVVAIVGIGAYRTAFQKAKARIGLQDEKLETAAVWVLPNPSGLNAHYTPTQLAAEFRKLLFYLHAPEI